jgi:hypothetical protein
LHDGYVPFF